MRTKFKALPGRTKYGKRHVPGVMNKTESEYADILEHRRREGLILAWRFERKAFKLGENRCSYCPDFEVIRADGSKEYIDVKGSGPIDDKSIVKIKVAADAWWEYDFAIVQKQTKANGGGWKRTDY
jgi:hypothetical protein